MKRREEAALIARMAAELRTLCGQINFESDAQSIFSLIGCLQLAWRHPGLSESQKEMISRHVELLSRVFTTTPALLEAIKLGWGATS